MWHFPRISRGGSRAATTSNMELFVIIVLLATVLDLPLISFRVIIIKPVIVFFEVTYSSEITVEMLVAQ